MDSRVLEELIGELVSERGQVSRQGGGLGTGKVPHAGSVCFCCGQGHHFPASVLPLPLQMISVDLHGTFVSRRFQAGS